MANPPPTTAPQVQALKAIRPYFAFISWADKREEARAAFDAALAALQSPGTPAEPSEWTPGPSEDEINRLEKVVWDAKLDRVLVWYRDQIEHLRERLREADRAMKLERTRAIHAERKLAAEPSGPVETPPAWKCAGCGHLPHGPVCLAGEALGGPAVCGCTGQPDHDVVCEHGTAADVNCPGCHSGFIFDAQGETNGHDHGRDSRFVRQGDQQGVLSDGGRPRDGGYAGDRASDERTAERDPLGPQAGGRGREAADIRLRDAASAEPSRVAARDTAPPQAPPGFQCCDPRSGDSLGGPGCCRRYVPRPQAEPSADGPPADLVAQVRRLQGAYKRSGHEFGLALDELLVAAIPAEPAPR